MFNMVLITIGSNNDQKYHDNIDDINDNKYVDNSNDEYDVDNNAYDDKSYHDDDYDDDDDEYLDHDANTNTPPLPGLHPGLVLDFSQLYLGAQSSGSHVAVEFLKQRGDCQDVQVGQNEEM